MRSIVNHIIASCLVFVICAGHVGCVKESHENVVMMAVGLQSVNDYWVKHGRPKDFDPASVIKSSCERYSVFTNVIEVGGNAYHCRFAASSLLKCAVTKAQDSSGRDNPTRQLTLQPVAAEARMEAMNCAKPLV